MASRLPEGPRIERQAEIARGRRGGGWVVTGGVGASRTIIRGGILFNADVPADTIRIRWADFAARVRPIVGKFAGPPLDRVGSFRLSYRE